MVALRSFPARCGISLLSGLVYALAYPPLGWGWLVVPGLAGLLIALQGQHGSRARALGFIHGMAAYGVGLSWLFQIFGSMVVPLWCVLAVFTALFAAMQSRASLRGVTGGKLAAFTALNWCGWEFIRAELFPLKFPWMTAGLAIGPNSLLPWIGVYGVGAVVVLAAAYVSAARWREGIPLLVLLLVMVNLPVARSVPDAGDPLAVKVAGLQMEGVSVDGFLAATRELPADIQHVVWPEYAVPYDIRKDVREWRLARELCREKNITLTLGTQSRRGQGDEWHNIALTIDPAGVRGEHNKVHTVHFFDDGTAGTTARPVPTAHGMVGTPVCFDCDYEGIVRRMTAAGAEMIVVPVMDAESWTARQHEQHAELFRIRACENGRWMFVCASSGVSQVIDPSGHVHARLPVLTAGTLTGKMRRESGLTFYTRYGFLTPWCALVVAGVCWITLLLPGRIFKRLITSLPAGVSDVAMNRRIPLLLALGLALLTSAGAQNPAGFRELKIGEAAPDFSLIGIDGKTMALGDFKDSKILAIAFTSNHCPVSNAAFPRFIKLYQELKDQGFGVVAINPNHPDGLRPDELGYSKYGDSYEEMKLNARDKQFPFPYLYDGETQATAMAYGCLATPHIFLFDQERKLRYKGRIDDSRFPGGEHVKSPDLRNALTALIAGQPVPVEITNPIGCSTKWRTKKSEVLKDDEKWAAVPVSIDRIDAAGVAKLRANPTNKYRLINIWSTTCAPCAEEFPGLVRVARRMGLRPFELVTISTDLPEDQAKAEAFLKKHRAGLPGHLKAGLEQEGRATNNFLYTEPSMDPLIKALDPEWTGMQPHTILVAPGGDIAFRHAGMITETELLEKVLEVMTPYFQPGK